ncbi:MAG: SRPBCC domain-containing protein [Actinobacteria bacterium]|nr:SRPBCC domain-containing protein [Actinomycetota bacterium]
MKLTTARRLHLDADRAVVWTAMTQVRQFTSWWPWLHHFDGTELVAGSVWTCVVQPPLPYSLRFTVALEEVVAPSFVLATVTGDVEGTASVALEEEDSGCLVVLGSSLTPREGVLRVVATLVPPVARYGHDWVLDTGARQFADRVASQREG